MRGLLAAVFGAQGAEVDGEVRVVGEDELRDGTSSGGLDFGGGGEGGAVDAAAVS